MPAKNDPPATPTPAVMAPANPPAPSPSPSAPAPSPAATPAGPVVSPTPPTPPAAPSPPSAPSPPVTPAGPMVSPDPPASPSSSATPAPEDPPSSPPSEPEDLDARYRQRAGQIRRALAELANARGAGLGTRVQAVRKELAELGYTGPETDITEESGQRPVGRSTRQQRAITTVGGNGDTTVQGANPSGPPSAPSK